jgi:hypothetical protein
MSFAVLLMVVGANAAATTTTLIAPDHEIFLEMSLPAIAAENSTLTRHGVATTGQASTDRPPDQTIAAYPDRHSSLDLAIYVGDRHSGPQLELGALGGGRADAPSLVHVGFGFDF